ncbi:MAG: hypothetical protein JXQ23_01720 [Clostridia bacterium]|nr:hypothetical protein [Clostridia bacterium]
MIIYKQSKASHNNTNYYISLIDDKKYLCLSGSHDGFEGRYLDEVFIAPLTPENARLVRKIFPWLNPKPLSVNTSFGLGDRLGYATLGHIKAIKGTNIFPIFAQQSVRENTRVKRTPQNVMDDAMWQVFESGYKGIWGADADHIKEIEDIEPFIEAGFTFYTIDPSQYVDNQADSDTLAQLKDKIRNISFDKLQTDEKKLIDRYLNKSNTLDIETDELSVYKALIKYGNAIAHVKKMSDYLMTRLGEFDLEMSVDETLTPTSAFEHYFIVKELRRLEVHFTSLAPRFVGSFEKGVDYIGDLTVFKEQLKKHVRIMNYVGGYKLSVHTGSDKFSVYEELSLRTGNKIHIKTAGTSYLEALKVIATVDKPFFRELFDYCKESYQKDRQTYQVSAELTKVPDSKDLSDDELLDLFSQFDARQVMHVTFGSVLDKYKEKFDRILHDNIDLYSDFIEEHFKKHLKHFAK